MQKASLVSKPDSSLPQSVLSKEIERQRYSFNAAFQRQSAPLSTLSEAISRLGFGKDGKRLVDTVAIGSSHNAALVAGSLAKNFTLRVQAPDQYEPFTKIALVISQSGETGAILKAAEGMKSKGIKVAAITNNAQSPLAKMADRTILLGAHPEEAIAATGTVTSTIMSLLHLDLQLGKKPGFAANLALLRVLEGIQYSVQKLLDGIPEGSRMFSVVSALSKAKGIVFLGQGPFEWVAREAALKAKETAEIFSESYGFEAFEHGPKAPYAARPGQPISEHAIVLFNHGLGEAALNEKQEFASKNRIPVCQFTYGEDFGAPGSFHIQESHIYGQVLLSMVACQILAHDLAAIRGLEPGVSSSLSKVVGSAAGLQTGVSGKNGKGARHPAIFEQSFIG